MSTEHKPQPDAEEPHMEKQTMTEPQEEFITDQSVPSQPATGAEEVKEAGHQEKPKGQSFEPGVEG